MFCSLEVIGGTARKWNRFYCFLLALVVFAIGRLISQGLVNWIIALVFFLSNRIFRDFYEFSNVARRIRFYLYFRVDKSIFIRATFPRTNIIYVAIVTGPVAYRRRFRQTDFVVRFYAKITVVLNSRASVNVSFPYGRILTRVLCDVSVRVHKKITYPNRQLPHR